MKAIVKLKEGKGYVELIEKPAPIPGPGEVKIKVESAGICGTDIKIRNGDAWSNPPVVLCHEFSGMIIECGEGVNDFQPGDCVVSETAQVVCGKCYYCMSGHALMCPQRLSIGYGVDGAFANYIVVRRQILHRIPEGVSFDQAALCEPLAVAVHAVFDSVTLTPTDRVLVIGPGTIGLLVAQVVKSFGCEVICTGTDADKERLETARGLGIDHIFNTQRENLAAFVESLTAGMGIDYVFDCSGAASAIVLGIAVLKRMGTLIQVGLTKPTLEIPYALLPQRELCIRGTFGHNWKSWKTALELMASGKVNVSPLISHIFPMDQWEAAFEMAEKQQGIKVLIHPNQSGDT